MQMPPGRAIMACLRRFNNWAAGCVTEVRIL
jgi:hypothetical protein